MSFKVKAIYEYSSPHEDDLQFPLGQVITVIEEEDADWYTGEYVDDAGAKHEGIFPRNFVEKYEPVAPPRPARTRPKKEPELPSEEPAAAPEDAAPVVEAEEASPTSPPPPPAAEPITPASPPAPKAREPVLPSSPPRAPAEPVGPQSPPKAAPVKRGPPPVSDKPASSSFKDRIAAFNKPAAPPIAPFKPGGLGAGGSSSFIKKPFVAPPPKGNTYVPTQRAAPVAPVYRREEDPEIKEREAENVESAQKAGLLPSEPKEGEEDQPKPMSLKERMALLQRQQQEQAQRHAEAAAKKEKPKRPAVKPRMSSHEPGTEVTEAEEAAPTPSLERRDTGETGGKRSMDEPRPPRVPAQPRRKPSNDPEPRDGNEADMSGAGETTEDQEDLTEREDSDEKPRRPSRVSIPAQPAAEAEEEGEEEEVAEDDQEDEEDEETKEFRRKEELRARMARLGGGMGMPGMFGMPMPGAAPSLPPKKKKAPSSEKQRTSEDSQPLPSPRAPPVPLMMALPGMGAPKKPAEEESDVDDEAAETENVTPRSPPAGKFLQILIRYLSYADTNSVPSAAPGGAPPIPGGRPAPPPVPADCMYKPANMRRDNADEL